MGWNLATIDDLTLPLVREITAEWNEAPPLVFLVDALVRGFSSQSTSGAHPISDSDIYKLVSEVGSALPVVARDPNLPKSAPVFDLSEMRQRNAMAIKNKASTSG